MQYPGRVIKMGETDAAVVKALKNALNRALVLKGVDAVPLDSANPRFGPQMKQAVQLFQARNVDPATGAPLKPDGEVGSITWAVLFGAGSVASNTQAASNLLAKALAIAATQVGVLEQPRNSNRGPMVDQYLRRAGVPPGLAWCCAFTYWCFDEAARASGRPNPMVRTAGCLDHWNRAAARGARRIAGARAASDPAIVSPGMVFIMDFGRGLGHTGFVERVDGGFLHTIEGNTDPTQSREGGGVYRLVRKMADIKTGYIDYSAV
jgi:CHAP domain/Putative peptidoglycan binding domain